MILKLYFRKLDQSAIIPAIAHPGDAGHDLHAIESGTLAPGERARVGTGISVAIPQGHAGLVLPRSGLAARHGVSVVNAPGLIDSGYRGELKVLLLNTDRKSEFAFAAGDRIAQLIIVGYAAPAWCEVSEFDDTLRGESGFGSTGA